MGDHRDTPHKAAQRRQMPERRSDDSSVGKFRKIFEKRQRDSSQSGGTSPEERSAQRERESHEGTTLSERHPDWQLDVTLVLGNHDNVADGEGLKPYVAQADVCFFENSSRNESLLGEFQRFASMNPSPEAAQILDEYIEHRGFVHRDGTTFPMKGGFLEAVVRSVYEAPPGAIVGHIDLIPSDPIDGEDIKEELERPFCVSSFDKTLDNLRGMYKSIAEMQEEREHIMTGRLESEVERILGDHPELLGSPLQIMISLGAKHRTLADKLEAQGIHVRKEFMVDPAEMPDHTIEELFVQGEEPSRELLAKLLFQYCLTPAIELSMSESPDEQNHSRYMQEVLSQITTKEIKEYYTRFTDRAGNIDIIAMDRFFRKRGFPSLPQTNAELDAAIIQLEQREKHGIILK